MKCLNCNKETNNPKFCNRSCSAIYNNRAFPKRKKGISDRIKVCKNCGKEYRGNARKYCSNICYLQTKQSKMVKKIGAVFCKNCGNVFYPKTKEARFCSPKCSGEFAGKPIIEAWLAGEISGNKQGVYNDVLRNPIRNYILKQANYTCSCCGLNEWNGKPIPLQVHHKDGDAHNNKPENIEVVCWNCHAQTETFGSKNKKSTRKSRYK